MDYLFFPTLAAVLQGMKPAEDFFDMTDAFLEIPALGFILNERK